MAAGAQSWIRGRLLGAGAFGSVHLAMNREDGQVFAVKSVAVTERVQQGAVRAIENEIALLQALDSRHVVKCLGSDWTEEGGQCMRNVFLEYMPDGCLTDFVKQFASGGALEDEHLLRTYTRSIVEGIHYLHSRCIVHCDINGKNILVGNGSVKLTDFGSAKRVEQVVQHQPSQQGESNCVAVHGTPLWMAPEVVRQVEQGPASDIWSLGCTVVEMATGRAPWSNLAGMNHFVALYHIGCTDDLPAAPAWLSADARDFLSHCFERDPRQRWTSAQLLQHPFLTTRFVAASPIPASSMESAPVSPVSVLGFNCELSDSSCFVNNSVLIPAAAPSLFKRGLVSAQKVQSESPSGTVAESDWWNCHSRPGSPESAGPWIVVRSPKTHSPCSLHPSPFSDWISPAVESSFSSAESLIVAGHGYGDEDLILSSCEEEDEEASSLECHVQQSWFTSPASSLAADLDFCEMDICDGLRLDRLVRLSGVFVDFSDLVEDEARSNSLLLGFSTVKDSVNTHSELVNQYLNPQILLYWWQGLSRLAPRMRYIRSSVVYRKCGRLGLCIIPSLDEYASLLMLGKRSLPPSLEFLRVCLLSFACSGCPSTCMSTLSFRWQVPSTITV